MEKLTRFIDGEIYAEEPILSNAWVVADDNIGRLVGICSITFDKFTNIDNIGADSFLIITPDLNIIVVDGGGYFKTIATMTHDDETVEMVDINESHLAMHKIFMKGRRVSKECIAEAPRITRPKMSEAEKKEYKKFYFWYKIKALIRLLIVCWIIIIIGNWLQDKAEQRENRKAYEKYHIYM